MTKPAMRGDSPNQALLGQPASRSGLATPALILDLDVLERNIAVHARYMRDHGLRTRPHAKTHKSPEVARKQIEAGALGVCCATVKEAAVLASAGIKGILLTTPIVSPAKIQTIVELSRAAGDLAVVVDSSEAVELFEHYAARAGCEIDMLIDIDIGPARTGVRSPEEAILLAEKITNSTALRYHGIQAYSGLVQHIAAYADRVAAYTPQLARLEALCAKLEMRGYKPGIVSGGGTGTLDIDCKSGLFTEHQAGSYCVMDVEYDDVELTSGEPNPFDNALFVGSTVISANAAGHVTTDAGIKSFAMDGPNPRIAGNPMSNAVYTIFGDEHGKIACGNAETRFPLGRMIELIVPHCDPTVNLHDYYHCVRGDRLVAIWPIDARGVI